MSQDFTSNIHLYKHTCMFHFMPNTSTMTYIYKPMCKIVLLLFTSRWPNVCTSGTTIRSFALAASRKCLISSSLENTIIKVFNEVFTLKNGLIKEMVYCDIILDWWNSLQECIVYVMWWMAEGRGWNMYDPSVTNKTFNTLICNLTQFLVKIIYHHQPQDMATKTCINCIKVQNVALIACCGLGKGCLLCSHYTKLGAGIIQCTVLLKCYFNVWLKYTLF